MSLKKLTALSVAGLLVVALAAPVFAAGEALTGADVITKRQELMRANGGILRSATGLTGQARIDAAQTLVDDFSQIGELFPEDSQTGDTKAAPAIWTDKEGFMKSYNESLAAAAAVLVAAQTGDDAAWGTSLSALNDTCGACHMTYRLPR